MALYDASGVYAVRGGGGGCCGGLCRIVLMFITVLSTTFTIGTLIIAGSALYNVYNEPDQYAVDGQGRMQLWVLVASSGAAVFINICGFSGALFRIRCLLLVYALMTSVAVGVHMAMLYLQRKADGSRRHMGQLNITDDPHSVWTVEMSAYSSHLRTQDVLSRLRPKHSNSSMDVERINRTVHQMRERIVPNTETVKQSGLNTVNTIQAFLRCCGKAGVDDYISKNITIPESCCRASADCSATLRRHPRRDRAGVRRMVHRTGCGPFLHVAHDFVVSVIIWVGYVVAGSQLCGAVIAMVLAFCCTK